MDGEWGIGEREEGREVCWGGGWLDGELPLSLISLFVSGFTGPQIIYFDLVIY
jgi:hypothetical protein